MSPDTLNLRRSRKIIGRINHARPLDPAARSSSWQPEVDEDVRAEYEAPFNGARLPGREKG
jgi:hypothetical protein